MTAHTHPRDERLLANWTRAGLVVAVVLFLVAMANVALALTDPAQWWSAIFFERLRQAAPPMMLAICSLWSFPAMARILIQRRERESNAGR